MMMSEYSSPGQFYESANRSLRSPCASTVSTKRKEATNQSQVSQVRTQLSLERKKVQDLNKCVHEYSKLKEKCEQKSGSHIEELQKCKQELASCQKEIGTYQYKVSYLEGEKLKLEKQIKQMKVYIGKLEASLAAQNRGQQDNKQVNRSTTINLNQSFPQNDHYQSNDSNNNQQNISQGGTSQQQKSMNANNQGFSNSQQTINVSNVSQGLNKSQTYVKKLEDDVRNFQEEIKILKKALDINSPKVSIKRSLNSSTEEIQQKSASFLAIQLAECKETINRTESIESDLRQKIFALNKELENALIVIEEDRISRENDQEEIANLQNEIATLRQSSPTPRRSQQYSQIKNDRQEGDQQQLAMKEALRELTEQLSEAKGKLTEQSLQAYSDNQKWTKQIDELKEELHSKEDQIRDEDLKTKKTQLEVDALNEKYEKLKAKKGKQATEIGELQIQIKQLETINANLGSRIRLLGDTNEQFKEQLTSALNLQHSSKKEQAELIVEEVEFTVNEAIQLRQAVEEAINKYLQQALLNNDLKEELKRREQQIERQADHKAQVQSTLSQQIYNLRCQNTDLIDSNSTIRRECATFMESLKPKNLRSLKKKRRSRTIKQSSNN